MSVLNLSKDVEVLAPTECPHDNNFPINKLWRWKEGKRPAPNEDGLISYSVIDSAVLGIDGLPKVVSKHMPVEFANDVNYVDSKRTPYPPPCDPLPEDMEFYVAGPGMFSVRKKQEKKLTPDEMILAIYNIIVKGV